MTQIDLPPWSVPREANLLGSIYRPQLLPMPSSSWQSLAGGRCLAQREGGRRDWGIYPPGASSISVLLPRVLAPGRQLAPITPALSSSSICSSCLSGPGWERPSGDFSSEMLPYHPVSLTPSHSFVNTCFVKLSSIALFLDPLLSNPSCSFTIIT